MSESLINVPMSSKFEQNLHRLMATSKKPSIQVLREEGKRVFMEVARYTPPAHKGVLGIAAERNAKRKVRADIMAVYGTVDDAWDMITEAKDRKTAKVFWYLQEHGMIGQANTLLKETTGSILHDFDGGAHHRKNFRRRTNRFRFIVANRQSLESYIQQQQSHVWWLASGWEDALKALGAASLPYGLSKHPEAPGDLEVEIDSTGITITAINRVKYGSQLRGIERRIRWAMNVRADRMQRNWEDYTRNISGVEIKS